MQKIFLGLVAATAVAATAAALTASASAAQPTTTTHNIAVPATSWTPIDLPALNSQFTKMTLTASGTAHWGPGIFTPTWDISGQDYANDAGHEYTTGYDANGDMVVGVHTSTGKPADDILLEGRQVGAVIFRVDGGAWRAVNGHTEVAVTDGRTHIVQVAYNDRPDAVSFADNSGSLNVTVVRTKA